MRFLYPVFLTALAAAIPVVLHFLRRDIAPEVPFSAVRLLRGRRSAGRAPPAARSVAAGGARPGAPVAGRRLRPSVSGRRGRRVPGLRIVAIDSLQHGWPGALRAGAGGGARARRPGGRRRTGRGDRLRRSRGGGGSRRGTLRTRVPRSPASRRALPEHGMGRFSTRLPSWRAGSGGRLIVVTDLQAPAGTAIARRSSARRAGARGQGCRGAAAESCRSRRCAWRRIELSPRLEYRVRFALRAARVERDSRRRRHNRIHRTRWNNTEVSIPFVRRRARLACRVPGRSPGISRRTTPGSSSWMPAADDGVLIVATGAGAVRLLSVSSACGAVGRAGDRRAARVIASGRRLEVQRLVGG